MKIDAPRMGKHRLDRRTDRWTGGGFWEFGSTGVRTGAAERSRVKAL